VAKRRQLAAGLEPLRKEALDGHPWTGWAEAQADGRMPGGESRRSAGKDLSWESPCAPSAWPRSSTTTCRATDSATLRLPALVAGQAAAGPPVRPARRAAALRARPDLLVGVERLLRRRRRSRWGSAPARWVAHRPRAAHPRRPRGSSGPGPASCIPARERGPCRCPRSRPRGPTSLISFGMTWKVWGQLRRSGPSRS
jgi:hypothetical protein